MYPYKFCQHLHSKKVSTNAVHSPTYHNNLTRFTSYNHDLFKKPSLVPDSIDGDKNINLVSPNNSGRDFIDVMFSSSFDQHITIPTRVTKNTSTLVDHISSNNIDRIISGIFDAGTSDHHISFAFILPMDFKFPNNV